MGRWGVGGRCCWVGECTKHVAKEDRAIASECAEPKVHSSTSPAHPRALRASQRVVVAPSTQWKLACLEPESVAKPEPKPEPEPDPKSKSADM